MISDHIKVFYDIISDQIKYCESFLKTWDDLERNRMAGESYYIQREKFQQALAKWEELLELITNMIYGIMPRLHKIVFKEKCENVFSEIELSGHSQHWNLKELRDHLNIL